MTPSPTRRRRPGPARSIPASVATARACSAATDVEDIETAAAYLVQVVAREPLDADARIELSERTLRQAVEEASGADDADEDDGRAGALGQELAAGFLRDIERLNVDHVGPR